MMYKLLDIGDTIVDGDTGFNSVTGKWEALTVESVGSTLECEHMPVRRKIHTAEENSNSAKLIKIQNIVDGDKPYSVKVMFIKRVLNSLLKSPNTQSAEIPALRDIVKNLNLSVDEAKVAGRVYAKISRKIAHL